MELLKAVFPVSGVETYLFIPPLVSFFISFFTSMSGVSGAFLLIPFQMSVLNFTSPSVSSTNLVFNLFAIPGGIYRYIRERRMAWPLAWTITAGTVPGVLLGYYIRVLYLPDPRTFKLFVGTVLLYISYRLLLGLGQKSKSGEGTRSIDNKFKDALRANKEGSGRGLVAGLPASAVVKTVSVALGKTEYQFWGEHFSFHTTGVFLLSLAVGVIGGVYGIGGGAIIAPLLVTLFHLPVYTIAGATLMGTLITSVFGIFIYSFIPVSGGMTAPPDWLLGILFGSGGFAGMYLGARVQKYVPQTVIKVLLGLLILLVALKYILQFFR